MKLFCIIIIVTGIFSINVLQAQTTKTELNQKELMKQFLGNWVGTIGKDTTIVGRNIQFGAGMVCNSQIVTRGKTLDSVKQLWGYDSTSNKIIVAELIKSSPVVELCAMWFTSKNAGEMVLLKDISNSGGAVLKWEFEFKSPHVIIQTATQNDRIVKVLTLTRE